MDDYQQMLKRPVPPRVGKPLVAGSIMGEIPALGVQRVALYQEWALIECRAVWRLGYRTSRRSGDEGIDVATRERMNVFVASACAAS